MFSKSVARIEQSELNELGLNFFQTIHRYNSRYNVLDFQNVVLFNFYSS